ncbi:hypothetical protein P7K49_015655, partial [Saguinus oedipus]
ATTRGLARSPPLCQSLLSGAPGPIPGAQAGSPHPGRPRCLPPSVPCQTFQGRPRAGPPHPRPGPRPSTRCGARPGRREAAAWAGGGERAWAAPSPGRRSPGWLQSLGKMVPSPPPGTVNQRPPLPGRPRAPLLPARPDTPPRGHLRPASAPGQTLRAAGRRWAPAAARARPFPAPIARPPARPLTFHGGEQRQQQQRGPQPPQGHGCASRSLGPRRRGPRAARAGARAPGSGGRGERRGAAHTQPPPPRSQQNEPSSPGRTGTRAPPALGTAHLSRGRGGTPAGPPPPRARPGPGRPRTAPSPCTHTAPAG